MDRLLVERWLILGQADAGPDRSAEAAAGYRWRRIFARRAVRIAVSTELVAIYHARDPGLGDAGRERLVVSLAHAGPAAREAGFRCRLWPHARYGGDP
jgi:hypothetical protein